MVVKTNPNVKRTSFHYGWLIVFGGFLTQIILIIAQLTLPLVMADVKVSLNLDNTSAGTIVSVFGLCYAGFSFFWGYLADKFGTRITMSIAGLLASLMIIVFGQMADTFSKAIIIFAIIGFGTAGIYSATIPKLIGEWFHPSKRGRAMSLITPGGVLTGAALGILAPQFAKNYGWQNTFSIFGLFALVITIAIFLIIRNQPSEKRLRPVGEPIGEASSIKPETSGPKKKVGFLNVIKLKITWHLAIMYIFWQLAFMTILAFLAVAIRGFGFTAMEAGLAVTIYNLCQLIGQQIWGPLSDRIERKTVIAISSIWTMLFTFGFAFVFGKGLAWMYIMAGLMGVGIGNVPVLLATFSDYYSNEVRGTGTGLISTMAVVGRFFGPMLAGILADRTGNMTSVFIFAAVMLLISAVISLPLPSLRTQKT